MPPNRVLQSVECCSGISPSQAANCLPELNCSASVTAAAMAVAVMIPRPGMVASLRLASFCACQAAICWSSVAISLVSATICRISVSSAARA